MESIGPAGKTRARPRRSSRGGRRSWPAGAQAGAADEAGRSPCGKARAEAELAEAEDARAASLAEAEVFAPWNGWDEDEDHEDTLDLDVPMRGRICAF